MEPWLKIISDTRTPLSGIISLPLLSEKFVDQLSSDSSAKILVSQEVPSNLRQSVFIDGKLVLSRLVPIASFYHGDYASDVVRDIESTQRYLISQRIVERTDNVAVHILSNKRHRDKLTIKCAEQKFTDYQVHEINQLLEEQKIEVNEEQDFSSALFCYLASKKVAINHYAQSKQKKYYQHHKASLILKVATIAVLAAGIGFTASSLVKGWLYNSTVSETSLVEQKYKAKFNQLSESRIDSTTSTTSMQHIVQTVEILEAGYLQDPEEMLSIISRDISLFTDIRVTGVEWFVSDISDAVKANEVGWGKAVASKKTKRSEKKKKQRREKGFFEVANVDAEFINFNGNYRYALSAVDDLEKSMAESGNYFYVEITKRPLDIESDNSLTGDAGTNTAEIPNKAEVSFRVVRKVEANE